MISLLGLLSYLYMGEEFLSKDKQQQQQQKLFIFIIRSIHRLARIHKEFEKLGFRFLHQVVGV